MTLGACFIVGFDVQFLAVCMVSSPPVLDGCVGHLELCLTLLLMAVASFSVFSSWVLVLVLWHMGLCCSS